MHLEDAYNELLKLSSPYEKMIARDLARTFPSRKCATRMCGVVFGSLLMIYPEHEFFQQAEGQGHLFNVMVGGINVG